MQTYRKILKKLLYYSKRIYFKCGYTLSCLKKSINHTLYSIYRRSRNSNVVMYCCIVDGYDRLAKHTKINWNWDYICFTDNPNLYEKKYFGAWKIVPISHKEESPHLTNRYYKFKPHLVCKDYDFSIYVDGNIDIISNSFFKTYAKYIKTSAELVLILHPERGCVYEESKACIEQKKDSEANIGKIVSFLKTNNFPENYGLTANRIIFSNNNCHEVSLLFDETFEFIKKLSKRDQLALSYILWKKNFVPKYLDSAFLTNYVSIFSHSKQAPVNGKRYGNSYQSVHSAILSSKDNPLLLFLRNLDKGGSVLEFGPSWGYYTRFLKIEKKCSVSICEFSKSDFKEAMQYAVDGICGDIDTLSWVEHFENKKFNYIFFFDVLEHLKNPYEQIMYAERVLHENGLIIVSVPNIAYNAVIKMLIDDRFTYNEFGILDKTHLRFFAYKDLNRLVSNTSLSIKSISFIYRDEKESYIDYSMRGWKKIFSPLLKLRKHGKVFQFFLVIGKNNNER